MAKINTATTQLNLGSDDERSNFHENDMSVHSGNLDMHFNDYECNIQEVSLEKFNTAYDKKYANPKTFLHVLWNVPGSSAGAMVTCFNIIKDESEGQPGQLQGFARAAHQLYVQRGKKGPSQSD